MLTSSRAFKREPEQGTTIADQSAEHLKGNRSKGEKREEEKNKKNNATFRRLNVVKSQPYVLPFCTQQSVSMTS